jgi:hypothetical protein
MLLSLGEQERRTRGAIAVPSQSCLTCGNENSQGAAFCTVCGAGLSQGEPRTQAQYRQIGQLQHSGLGIASFVLSLISAALFSIYVAAYATPSLGQLDWGDNAIPLLLLLLLLLALVVSGVGSVIALALGVTELLRKQRSGLFAVLGTLFSVAVVLSLLSFVIVNLSFW